MTRTMIMIALLAAAASPIAAAETKTDSASTAHVKISEWAVKEAGGAKTVQFMLENTTTSPLRGISGYLTLFDRQDKIVGDTERSDLAMLLEQTKVNFRIKLSVPDAAACRLHLAYSDGLGLANEYTFYTKDVSKLPKLEETPTGPAAAAAGGAGDGALRIATTEAVRSADGASVDVTVSVENRGKEAAENVAFQVQFLKAGGPVKTVSLSTGGGFAHAIPAGGARQFTMSLKGVPDYDGYTVSLDAPAGAGGQDANLEGGEFTDKPEVQMAHVKFSRTEDGKTLAVKAQVKNGLATGIRDLKVVITFTGRNGEELKDAEGGVPGDIGAGEVKDLEIGVQDPPQFSGYQYRASYKGAGGR